MVNTSKKAHLKKAPVLGRDPMKAFDLNGSKAPHILILNACRIFSETEKM
jgi:hypothetical protein